MLTPSKVLPIEFYKVSRANEMNRTTKLEEFRDNLETSMPEYVNQIVDGFNIIGKTSQYQQYVGEKEGKFYNINISKIKGLGNKNRNATEEVVIRKTLDVKTTKLKDVKYDPNLFIPLVSKSPLDKVFSTEGGIMPATNYILVGDPGIGKSSLSIQYAADLQEQNPDKKILFISAEMTVFDMIPYTNRFPLWSELAILFTSDLEERYYKDSIEQKVQEGYDFILIDSFAELNETVRGDWNDFNNKQKSKIELEKWLVNLMIEQNGGANNEELNTAFLCI